MQLTYIFNFDNFYCLETYIVENKNMQKSKKIRISISNELHWGMLAIMSVWEKQKKKKMVNTEHIPFPNFHTAEVDVYVELSFCLIV